MKIFVTGGSGLLGSKITEIALERGYDVYSGYCRHKPEFGKAVKLDLTDANSIVRAINDVEPDVIIHTAALTDVDRCEVDKDLAYKINVEGTKIIVETARKLNSFLIYISSDYVFNGSKGMYKEDDETNPANYYGYTKLSGEILSRLLYCEDLCYIWGEASER